MRPVKKHKAGKLRFRFSLLVDEKDEIIGFSIKGCGNITSRIFCGSFLQAMENGDVSIKLRRGWFLIPARIIFENCQYKSSRKCSFRLSKNEIESLREILKSSQSIKESSIEGHGNFKFYVNVKK